MELILYTILVYQVLILCGANAEDSPRVKLHKDLFSNDALQFRPEQPNNQATDVYLGITLISLNDVDDQKASIFGWLNVQWTNPALVWKPEQYGDINIVRSKPGLFWIPDLSFYSAIRADQSFVLLEPRAKPLVSSNGMVILVEPFNLDVVTTRGSVNGTEWMQGKTKIDSWSYDGGKVNLHANMAKADVSTFTPLSDWQLADTNITRNVKKYACCAEEYIDVTIEMNFLRKKN